MFFQKKHFAILGNHYLREFLFGECEAVCFSDDPLEKMIDHVRVLPWKTGLKRYFTPSLQ
jgi:hypothetical protein